MANRSDALFGPLPAAGAKRIGSHIDIRAVVRSRARAIRGNEARGLLQRHDSLLRLGWDSPCVAGERSSLPERSNG